MAEEKGLNPFGEVLIRLLEARGMTASDLAETIRARPEATEITGEDILAVMTAELGEEFAGLMNAFDEAVLREN